MFHFNSFSKLRKRLAACSFRGGVLTVLDRLMISRIGFLFPGKRKVVAIQLEHFVHPFYIRLGTTDWMVLDELFIAREYDSVQSCALLPVLNILDLGANIGFSIRLWHEMFPDAVILGIEPDEDNLRICSLNTLRLSAKLTLIKAFVGAENSIAKIDRSRGEWAFKMADSSDVTASGEEVQVKTVSEILDTAGWLGEIDFLKCDIEGAEALVFVDCRTWIQRVRNILIELHGDLTPKNFQNLLRHNGGEFDMNIWLEGSDYAVVFLTRSAKKSKYLGSISD